MTMQADHQASLRPTVELTTGTHKRITGWGWQCTCGDGEAPKVRKKDSVLREAQLHFDTKHGGQH